MGNYLKHVDLCSGIGGFSLAFEEVGLSRTIMFCDTEKWCRQLLAKHWPDVPITEDVKELANDPERLVPDCDILTAGYPCQSFSVAGKQRGTEDDRHIWPYIFRIVAHKRPTWCVFENVYGHVGMGLDEVLHDLESEGYSTRTFIVPASAIGARHKRDRLWVVAHTDSERRCSWDTKRQDAGNVGEPSRSARNNTRGVEERQSLPELVRMADGLPSRLDGFDGWDTEPEDIPRVVTGLKGSANTRKCLGNAIVPQIAMNIGLAIKEQLQ